MDRTQSRLILAMAAVLIALSVVLWQQGEPEEVADPEATELVWSLQPDAIAAVTVDRESGRLALERSGEDWRVTEPFDARADDDQVHDLLDALREMDRGIPVDGAEDRATEFGLGDPPHARVTVRLDDGTELVRDVGIPVPIGYRTYARSAAGGIVAVNGDPNEPLQAEASRYRDHRVFRFDPGEVRRVRIAGPKGTLDVHGQGLDWWLEGFTRADPDKVDDLVVGLLDFRFDVVMDLEQHVAEPTWNVTVALADGTEVWLRVGEETPMGVLAETSDGRRGMVFPDMLQQLGRGPTDIGATSAFGIRPDASETVSVRVPGHALEARRNGPGWQAEGIDDGAAYDAVAALAEVPIRYRLEPVPEPGPPWGEVRVSNGDHEQHVILGTNVVDGHRIALDAGGGEPFLVPAEALDEALATLPE